MLFDPAFRKIKPLCFLKLSSSRFVLGISSVNSRSITMLKNKTTKHKRQSETLGIYMSTPQRGFRLSRSLFCCHLRSDIFHSDELLLNCVQSQLLNIVLWKISEKKLKTICYFVAIQVWTFFTPINFSGGYDSPVGFFLPFEV